jgi:uncharacterized repeat protein (TIGR02543 family)
MKRFGVVYGVVGVLILMLSLLISCNEPTALAVYEITFEPSGGTNLSSDTKLVTFGSTYGTLPTVEYSEKVFSGWWTEANGNGNRITATSLVDISENQILYAKWSSVVTVAFDSLEGTNLNPTTIDVIFGESYGALPTATKTGYTLVCWQTTADDTGEEIYASSIVSEVSNHTLYAKWQANTYTISFEDAGGSNLNPTTIDVVFGESYGALPTTNKTGHTLGSWETMSNNTGKVIVSGTIVTEASNHTLYAKWQPNNYTITFDTQGGPDNNPLTRSVIYGERYDATYGDLSTPTWERHAFKFWTTGANGTGEIVRDYNTFTGTEDLTLYAAWEFEIFVGPAGGWVFYENPNYLADGWQYLEAAPYGWYNGGDDPKFDWGAHGYAVGSAAEDLAIGAGSTNTFAIVSYHNSLGTLYPEKGNFYINPHEYYLSSTGKVVAKICSEYSLVNGAVTYNDWFLPSLSEVRMFYTVLKYGGPNREDLGQFGPYEIDRTLYWSSSESSTHPLTGAWTVDMNNGQTSSYNKYSWLLLRPIRAFSL